MLYRNNLLMLDVQSILGFDSVLHYVGVGYIVCLIYCC